jgi:hypothetical protein
MKWFLYGISLLWIAAGSWIILYTSGHRNAMKRMIRGVDRKILSFLPAVIGVLLIIAASVSRHAWFLRVIGILGVIKGGIIFFNPKNMCDGLTNWYLDSMSDQTYRFFGIIALILGTAILSWIL